MSVANLFRIALWGTFALTVAILFINALYMLVSPTAWFALPGWLGLQGVLSRERYGKGGGALQVRILGGILLATLLWLGFSLLAPLFRN